MFLKKVKLVLDFFSDEGFVCSWMVWIGRVKVFVKYFFESEGEDSDDKENDNIKDWLFFGSDFEDEWGILMCCNVLDIKMVV